MTSFKYLMDMLNRVVQLRRLAILMENPLYVCGLNLL